MEDQSKRLSQEIVGHRISQPEDSDRDGDVFSEIAREVRALVQSLQCPTLTEEGLRQDGVAYGGLIDTAIRFRDLMESIIVYAQSRRYRELEMLATMSLPRVRAVEERGAPEVSLGTFSVDPNTVNWQRR